MSTFQIRPRKWTVRFALVRTSWVVQETWNRRKQNTCKEEKRACEHKFNGSKYVLNTSWKKKKCVSVGSNSKFQGFKFEEACLAKSVFEISVHSLVPLLMFSFISIHELPFPDSRSTTYCKLLTLLVLNVYVPPTWLFSRNYKNTYPSSGMSDPW